MTYHTDLIKEEKRSDDVLLILNDLCNTGHPDHTAP